MKLILSVFLLLSVNLVYPKPIDYFPVPATEMVRHTYFTLSYNEKYEEANWVYYTLTDSMVMNGREERSNQFKVDPLVPTGSAKSSDYTKSGYDRGHLCPAGDMGFDPKAMLESFLMSNVSPQTPDFNRGIWKELETEVRGWAKKEHQIIIVTGPVFKDNKGTIGKDHVLVPGYFYKIIFVPSGKPKMIAFLLPNARSDRPIKDFAVTTDEVERQSGLDFFPQLPDSIENRLEAKVELAGWFEGYAPSEPLVAQAKPAEKRVKSDLEFYLILVSVILVAVFFVGFWSRKRKH